jgi:hypothetical protein
MAAGAAAGQNRRMQNEANPEAGKKQSPRKTPRVIELETQIDQRDETIRLLNEALSRALDELNMLNEAA